MSADILIVDDETDIRNLIQGILEDDGYSTRQARNSQEAYTEIQSRVPSLIVLDIWLQGSQDDGLQILKKVTSQHPTLPVIMISGHGTIETAVSAIRDGAYDFIEKPFKSDRLLLMTRRALENAKLKQENETLKRQAFGLQQDLIGGSSAMQNIRQIMERVSATNSRVLISGEPGTGKDIVARMIHKNSARADKPFLVMNCATLRAEHFESELFGREEGLSDQGSKVGLLEQADGGTLLLDEISDMPLETQGKIVRVLQEQKYRKVGGTQLREIDVRVLATTNRNLEDLMGRGSFRQDLYYRLNVVPLAMPALRERTEDIQEFVGFFLKGFFLGAEGSAKKFSAQALNALRTYSWPGNIRQLRNVVEWVVIMHGSQDVAEFDVEHLPPEFQSADGSPLTRSAITGRTDKIDEMNAFMSFSLREAREIFEREYLLAQVERFEGNISKTAQFVGMERSALHRKLKSLQIASEKEATVTILPQAKKSASV